jgi:hypothetical protein
MQSLKKLSKGIFKIAEERHILSYTLSMLLPW